MTPDAAPDATFRLGGLVYGFGLIVLGSAILATVWILRPGVVALCREMMAALREHSAALRLRGGEDGAAMAEASERIGGLERQVAEIHARVCGGPGGH